jgi:serine protease inhibitor ecotin
MRRIIENEGIKAEAFELVAELSRWACNGLVARKDAEIACNRDTVSDWLADAVLEGWGDTRELQLRGLIQDIVASVECFQEPK